MTEVATTILEQLGGRRFAAMTGAYGFVGSANALHMRLRGSMTRGGINALVITLVPSDTYTMTFKLVTTRKIVDVETRELVYHDMLQEIFTAVTGLDTHL